MYTKIFEIRLTEELIAEDYKFGKMRTPVHLGIGQEAIAVATCNSLKKGDAVYSHHRAHNHFLASGGDIFSLIAELHGSELGCSKGRGGSVHLAHQNSVFFASNAILGESISLAVGSALSFSMQEKENIAVSFFGDAVFEEGTIYESMNFAAIHSLPVLFVCENNGYSTESPLVSRKAENSDFRMRVEAFGIQSFSLDGNDTLSIYDALNEIITSMRINKRPIFVECETYRWKEHVGPDYDFTKNRKYRSKEEFDSWQKLDPLVLLRSQLLELKLSTEEQLVTLENKIREIVILAFEKGKNANLPNASSLLENAGEV